jgi:hypothetical protein
MLGFGPVSSRTNVYKGIGLGCIGRHDSHRTKSVRYDRADVSLLQRLYFIFDRELNAAAVRH